MMLAGKVDRYKILGMLLNKLTQFLQTLLVNPVSGQFCVLKVGLFNVFKWMSEDHDILDARSPSLPQ